MPISIRERPFPCLDLHSPVIHLGRSTRERRGGAKTFKVSQFAQKCTRGLLNGAVEVEVSPLKIPPYIAVPYVTHLDGVAGQE